MIASGPTTRAASYPSSRVRILILARTLAVIFRRTLHQTHAEKALRLEPVHYTYHSLGAEWTGENHEEIAGRIMSRYHSHWQPQVFDLLGLGLGAFFSFESADPEITRSMVVHGRRHDRLGLTECLVRPLLYLLGRILRSSGRRLVLRGGNSTGENMFGCGRHGRRGFRCGRLWSRRLHGTRLPGGRL